MCKHFFKQLPRYVQVKVEPSENHLISFVGHNVWIEGTITQPLTVINYHNRRNNTKLICFVIINAYAPYDNIFGRTTMHNFRAIVSTIYRVVKFQAMYGIRTMYTKRKLGQEEKHGDAQNMNNNFGRSKISGGNKMLLEKKMRNNNRNTLENERGPTQEEIKEDGCLNNFEIHSKDHHFSLVDQPVPRIII
ncbi:unnamed protein product [Lactuca saligna]|uniref:Uncharacterized protein n=1 Tax=Lactuca saligna TaxID=75948 RepID=A0AA35Y6L2_LACSI|nr:unnamed protein product [Lactuca saligna]